MTSTRESLKSRLSLGFMIEKELGTPKISLQVDASTNAEYRAFCLRWKLGSARYRHLQSLHKANAPGWKNFENSLGSLQLLSWRLLNEWLNGDYHPEYMAEAARTAVHSMLPKPVDHLSPHPEFPAAVFYAHKHDANFDFVAIRLPSRPRIHASSRSTLSCSVQRDENQKSPSK